MNLYQAFFWFVMGGLSYRFAKFVWNNAKDEADEEGA